METVPLSQQAGKLDVPEYLTLNEVFEVDSDDDEGVFSSSDDDDDDEINNDESREEDHVCDILDGIKSTPGVLSTTATSSSQKRPVDRINSTDHADESSNDEMEKNESVKENKFLLALMTAAQSYSSCLRIPSAPSSSLTASTTQPIPSGTPTSSSLIDELDSEDDNISDVFSSEDEHSDNKHSVKKATLNAKDAARRFYSPTGPWAEFVNAPIEDSVVIAKLHAGIMCEAFIKRGTLGGRRITYISKTWKLCQKWEGFYSEMALYADSAYLRPLQGSVIPTIIGVYLVEGAISVAMELPSPTFWVEASEDMSDHLKRKCIAAFDLIHERGVLHNDVELRHMLIGADNNVTIIDFQMSRALKPIPNVDMGAATEADIRLEKRKVMYKLNYNDAQTRESEKRNRVFRRRDRNAERWRRRQQRVMRTPAGAKIVFPEDDDSEPEDPDDTLNPIVQPHIWRDLWLGEEFDPACYIVPGQDQTEVKAMLWKFAARERENQEKDILKRMKDNDLVAEKSELISSHFAIISTSQVSERDEIPIEVPAHSSLASFKNSQLTPILPTRISLKRSRENSELDSSEDALVNVRPQKKYQFNSPSEQLQTNGDAESLFACNSSDSLATTSVVSGRSSVQDTGSTAAPGTPSEVVTERIPAVIHVPYDGYTGAGGFTIPNTFTEKQISLMRRVWIMHDNYQRCLEEGLPYPLAERFGLTPSSNREIIEIGRNGKKRKRKLIVGRGSLKRAQRRKMAPREAKMRENELKDAMKEIRVGPRVLTRSEIEDYGRSQHSRTQTPADLPAPSSARQPQSILRRKLSPLEKARQRKYDEWLMRYKPQEPDDDDDDESQMQDQRSPKRLRVPGLPQPSPQPSRISKASGELGFQKYSRASTSLVPSPAVVNYSTASRSHSIQPTSFVAGPLLPSRLQSKPLPTLLLQSSSLVHPRASTSSTASSSVELTEFDSNSSEESDQAPSSSSLAPIMSIPQDTPSTEEDDIVEFDPHVRFGAWIPPAERQERADVAAHMDKDRKSKGGLVKRISDVISRTLGY